MFSNEKWFGASADFYPETIDQSLRFEDGDTARLSKTFGSGGDRKNWTWSAWVKRTILGINGTVFHSFAQGGFGIEGFIAFTSSDTINYQFDYNGGSHLRLITNRVFRDTTNFFHLCCVADSDNSTQGDRIRMYINGVRETSFSTENYPTNTTTDGSLNSAYSHYVGGRTNNTTMFDGYLAEVNFLDGVAVTDTNGVLDELVEIKNGVCIPKEYSGSYGTTGFRFTFADSSSLGDDTSGNTNDFTSSGLASTDVSNDSPTNNFCTMNPLQKGAYISLSEGNLKVAGNNATNSAVALGTFAQTSGKWYFEVRQGTVSSEFIGVMVKQVSFENSLIDGSNVAQTQGKGVVIRYNGDVRGISGELQSVSAFTYTAGDIIGIAFDMDNGAVYFAKNNTWLNSGDPTSGSSKTGSFLNFTVDDTRIATPALDSYTGGFVTGNFGQDSSFAGTETAQGNSDENGQGDFYYTPPSGYLALCSSNLPDTTLSPNQSEQADDYFNTVLYTGNATDDREVTGVGFKPDWGWFKERDDTVNHLIFDSSRGATKQLIVNDDASESTQANKQKTFTNDGYTLGTDGQVNGLNDLYVVWNWKANGGTTVSNTQGSITSTVQANTTAGFSIVQYTGDSTSNDGTPSTVGHGLNAVPKFIFTLPLDHFSGAVYHAGNTSAPETERLILKSTSGNAMTSDDAGYWNDTAPTSTVFSIGTRKHTNSNGGVVAYVFAEIEGYSKFGSYTGNGNADGIFVYTGFRPAWLMIKRTGTSGTSGWSIFDNKRNTFNPVDTILQANTTGTDGTSYPIDFLSNGFKVRDSGSTHNQNNSPHIYMAFSNGQNFKFGNSR